MSCRYEVLGDRVRLSREMLEDARLSRECEARFAPYSESPVTVIAFC